MFWYKMVDQNVTPPVDKSPENFAKSNFGEFFDQVLTAFVIQRSGGIKTSIGNPQGFKAW